MRVLGVKYYRTLSEKYARVQAKCDRMLAALHQGAMQAAYDR